MSMNNSSNWKKIRAAVLARDNHICAYCMSDQANTVDHIIPRSKGGTDDLDNLVAACASCNSSKQHRSVGQFFDKRSTAKPPVSNLSPTTVLRHSSPFQVPR